MSSFLRRIRGTIVMSFLSAAAWAPIGAVIGITSLYLIFRGNARALPISIVWRTAGRAALIFGAWGAVTGALTAVAIAIMARRRKDVPLSVRATAAYAGIAQGVLLIGARLAALQLPWHRVAVALHEMPLSSVMLAGSGVVGIGLVILRRHERVIASSQPAVRVG